MGAASPSALASSTGELHRLDLHCQCRVSGVERFQVGKIALAAGDEGEVDRGHFVVHRRISRRDRQCVKSERGPASRPHASALCDELYADWNSPVANWTWQFECVSQIGRVAAGNASIREQALDCLLQYYHGGGVIDSSLSKVKLAEALGRSSSPGDTDVVEIMRQLLDDADDLAVLEDRPSFVRLGQAIRKSLETHLAAAADAPVSMPSTATMPATPSGVEGPAELRREIRRLLRRLRDEERVESDTLRLLRECHEKYLAISVRRGSDVTRQVLRTYVLLAEREGALSPAAGAEIRTHLGSLARDERVRFPSPESEHWCRAARAVILLPSRPPADDTNRSRERVEFDWAALLAERCPG